LNTSSEKEQGKNKQIDTSALKFAFLQDSSAYSIFDYEIFLQSLKLSKAAITIFRPMEDEFIITKSIINLFQVKSDISTIKEYFISRGFDKYDGQLILTAINKVIESGEATEEMLYLKDASLHKRNKVYRLLIQPAAAWGFNNSKDLILYNSDITEVSHLYDDLAKEQEKVSEGIVVKNAFLNNISHEIREPMNTILGFTELLTLGNLKDEQRSDFLNIVKNKSRAMLSMIDDISELARFESDGITFAKMETNVPKLLNELLSEYHKELELRKKSNLELILKLPSEKDSYVIYTDSGRLYQVLNYLLDNALKYTDKGFVQFGYEVKDAKQLQFFVRDTGGGIPKEEQKYLFTRYRKKEEVVDKPILKKGLGLTISRYIVELMGGKIWVESTVGEGTTFYFTIPFGKEGNIEVQETNSNVKPFFNWRNKVILIVEDELVNYQFLEAVFADSHAQLVHVSDGNKAVELCKALNNIDLILMDIRLPEKDGYDAVKEIRQFRPTIPIIAQTAYSSKKERDKCKAIGFNEYITKPIDISLLIQMVNKYFN
jgi:signal transduction histidine kinase/CheY-like chemotaxis protein